MDDATKDLPAEGKSKVPATGPGAMSPLESLRREVDRLFEDFGPAGWRLPFPRPSAFEVAWPRAEPTFATSAVGRAPTGTPPTAAVRGAHRSFRQFINSRRRISMPSKPSACVAF